MRIQEAIILILFIAMAKCVYKEASESKNPLPYFRRKVEGISDGSTLKPVNDESNSNSLVSFLVKNAKEIFKDDSDDTEVFKVTAASLTPAVMPLTQGNTLNMMFYDNFSLTTLVDRNLIDPLTHNYIEHVTFKDDIENVLKRELMQISNEMKSYEKSNAKIEKAFTSINSYILETTDQNDTEDLRRSCIICDNIKDENCGEPQNKLVNSVTCKNEGDLCYSQHTPFGIVDRGCINLQQTVATYVCTCNLCNYISISDMPFIFSNKLEWVNNVVDLSRTRNFRKSVFKDMSCLRCEVNTTTEMGDLLDSANCMEGNLGNLPVQYCDENEICGIRAQKHDGYIWRGCLASPLYNYWWALCDSDLCNQDTLVSIYDYIEI